MGRRLLFPQVVFVALIVTASWGVLASAAQQASARASRFSAPRYTEGEVLGAFRSAGIKLADTAYGSLQPVKTLAEVNRRPDWALAVYVYRTKQLAGLSFNANIRAWRESGFAASWTKNVVVTVVPRGRILGVKARARPLPEPVAAALSTLINGSGS